MRLSPQRTGPFEPCVDEEKATDFLATTSGISAMVNGSDRTTKMTPKQIEVTAPEWREACAPATLPKWKIKMTEKIEACYGASNAGSSTALTH
jgi:hypothetical protein